MAERVFKKIIKSLDFKGDNPISREVIQQDILYPLERTALDSIKKEFPRQASDIIRQNQPLDNN